MKKSVIIPIILSLVFIAVNLYAQENKSLVTNSDELVVVSKEVVLPVIKVNPSIEKEKEVFVEFSLEDFELEGQYKVIVYDISGDEVFTLRSEKSIEIDKLPKNAKLLMKDGKSTYYIIDK